MTTQCTYLYGVVPADAIGGLDVPGVQDAEVRTIALGDLAALVSTIAPLRLHQLPADQVLRCLAQHQRVLEQALADGPVIPFKFGTCADHEDQVADILEAAQSELRRSLDAYAGKVEVDLAACWPDLKVVLGELGADPRVLAMKAEIAASGDLSAPQRVRLGQLVKDLLDQKRQALANEIARELSVLCSREIRGQTPDSPGKTGPFADRPAGNPVSVPGFLVTHPIRDDSMILSAAFLVERSQQSRFDQAIAELSRRHEGALSFRCVGPLPPYSFATAEVRTFSAEQLDAARRTLQLSPAASFAEIKLAYRRLLQEHHPDHPSTCAAATASTGLSIEARDKKGEPDSSQRLQQITAAYELLEEYVMNFRHLFGSQADRGLAVLKVRSLADPRPRETAHAA